MPIEYTDCAREGDSCVYHTVIEQVEPWRLPAEQKLINLAEDQVPLVISPEQDTNIEELIKQESWSALRVPFQDINEGISSLPHAYQYMGAPIREYLQESGLFSNTNADYFDIMNKLADFLRKEDDFDNDKIQDVIDHILGPKSKPYEKIKDKFHELKHFYSDEENKSTHVLIADGRPIGHDHFRNVAEHYLTNPNSGLWYVPLIHSAGSKIDFDLINNLEVPVE